MGASTSSAATTASASARRAARDAAHAAWVVTPPSPDALAALDGGIATATAALSSGAVSAEALTLASISRVHGVGHTLNAITHELFSSALASARASDARRAAGATLGLLDGVPVSIKDVFDVAGEDTTNGLAARAGIAATTDSAVVSALRAAGAVIVCKTNVPQALMVPESDNNIFGRTLHPENADRTPGGSSGGEGAIIAARAVCAGVGSDIGGSIRIPASFCGLVGFKPTPARVPHRGMPAPRPNGLDGQCAILPVAGPLAHSVDDAAALARVLFSPDAARGVGGAAWIAAGPTQPWDDAAFVRARSKRLVFALLPQDGFFALSPPCARALADAAAALRTAGHTVVPLDTAAAGIDLRAAAVSYFALLGADGALREFRSGLEGEALHPMYAELLRLASIPDVLRPAIGATLRAMGQTRLADVAVAARARSTCEWWALVAERNALVGRMCAALAAINADAILAPSLAVPAFRHGQSKHLAAACAGAFLFNTLGFPAGVVPAGRVRADECVYVPGDGEKDDFAAAAAVALEGAEGLPLAVQVAGPPYADEATLGALAVVEAALTMAAETSSYVTPQDGDNEVVCIRGGLMTRGEARRLGPQSIVKAAPHTPLSGPFFSRDLHVSARAHVNALLSAEGFYSSAHSGDSGAVIAAAVDALERGGSVKVAAAAADARRAHAGGVEGNGRD